jgi:dTMP kinase
MARGKLIVFEGLDRAGKSTQSKMLVETLEREGAQVKHMRFPGPSHTIGSGNLI